MAIRERLGLKTGDQIDFDEDSPILVGRRVVNREQWDKTIADWQKMAAECLKGDPWENMSSAEIMADLRGEPEK